MGTIYRAVESFPPTQEDFLSGAELGTPGAKRTICKHWGCSVWETMEAAEHGRKIYDRFRNSYIVVATLDAAAGEVLTTPSRNQPQHATFWKVHGLDVSGAFDLALEPDLPQPGDDPLGPS